jgi:hypothetical protein
MDRGHGRRVYILKESYLYMGIQSGIMINKNQADKKVEPVKRSFRSIGLKAAVVPLLMGIQAVATMPLLRAQINPQKEEKIWKPSINENTPYRYVDGVKMYDLGIMPRKDKSAITASPCEDKKDATTVHEDGIYSCPKLPSKDAGNASSGYFDPVTSAMTSSFAGYTSTGTTKFTTLEATWVVQPALGIATDRTNTRPGPTDNRPINREEPAYSAQWGGFGGTNDNTLIQAGTQSNFVKGKAQYIPWYELYPESAIAINNFPISAYDTMVETISAVPGEADTFTISLMDVTSNQGFNITVPSYITEANTADWVVERPQVCSNNVCGISNYPNTGIAFYGQDYVSIPSTVSAQANYADNGSGLMPISQLPDVFQLVMTKDSQNTTILAAPSALSSDGTSFTIYSGNSK